MHAGRQAQEAAPFSDSMDGSRYLFEMYLDMVSKEDEAIAKRWGDDASEILLFVSPNYSLRSTCRVNPNVIDWFVLCGRCGIACRVNEATQTTVYRRFSILSPEDLWSPRQSI